MPRNDTKIAWYFLSSSIDGLKILLNLKRSPFDGRAVGSNIVSSFKGGCCKKDDNNYGNNDGVRKKVSRELKKRKDQMNLNNAKETIERLSMVAEGLRQYSVYRAANVDITRTGPIRDIAMALENVATNVTSPNSPLSQALNSLPKGLPSLDKLPPSLKEVLKQPLEVVKNLRPALRGRETQVNDPDMGIVLPPIDTTGDKWPDLPPPIHHEAFDISPKRDEHQEATSPASDHIDVQEPPPTASTLPPVIPKPPKEKKPREISATSKSKKVPSSRIGRVASFGQLAAGLGIGALSEASKRTFGFGSNKGGLNPDYSAFLTEANLNRIVDTLCKVRGAALKLGQIISIQDDSIVSPQIAAAFERVRQSADFMPTYQMNRAMKAEFGSDWRNKFVAFNEKPFAAASIGQVHEATINVSKLSSSTNPNPDEVDGTKSEVMDVAVKIQYPGVAEGMDSDIKNLVTIMKFWKIVPDGMFIDQVIKVARKELFMEVDYVLEAESQLKYRDLMAPYRDIERINVPMVYPEVSTKKILITELINGVPIDKMFKSDIIDQDKKNDIAERLLRLTLREVFEFRFMQTDPNFSNYLYDVDNDMIHLLDFGAAREYSKEFTDKYFMVIKGAAEQDYDMILKYSKELGFLTGYESKSMEKAHVEAVMILGEAFADKNYIDGSYSRDSTTVMNPDIRNSGRLFDFSNQSTTKRISALVPVMLKERLTPPPEETYSLHRKMSGMFLLCAKLNAKIDCRKIYLDICDQYKTSVQ